MHAVIFEFERRGEFPKFSEEFPLRIDWYLTHLFLSLSKMINPRSLIYLGPTIS